MRLAADTWIKATAWEFNPIHTSTDDEISPTLYICCSQPFAGLYTQGVAAGAKILFFIEKCDRTTSPWLRKIVSHAKWLDLHRY